MTATEPSRRSVLVIGAGLVGIAVARALSVAGASRIGIHCRREAGLRAARSRLADVTHVGEWQWSSGDLFVPCGALTVGSAVLDAGADPVACRSWLSRLPRSNDRHRLRLLGRGWDVIVDCTNIATLLSDPNAYEDLSAGCTCRGSADCGLCGARFIGAIRHYGAAVDGLLRGSTRRFVKVSTTGLGAMGLDVPFTHGDRQAETMSAPLWRKVELAGVLHNTLWAVSRSFPRRVSLVVPAACVGFPQEDSFADVPAARMEDDGTLRSTDDAPVRSRGIWLGEDRIYSSDEMLLLSSDFMMGCVRFEDVADSVVRTIDGDSACDLLAAMSAASLGPSITGAVAREHAQRWLRDRRKHDDPVALGALGPYVVKTLLELDLLAAALEGGRLDECSAGDSEAIALRCRAELKRRRLDLGVLAKMRIQIKEATDGANGCAVDISATRVRAALLAVQAAVRLGRLPAGSRWGQLPTGDLCAALLSPALSRERAFEGAEHLYRWAADRAVEDRVADGEAHE
jgi:hypothetical protein